MVSRLKQPRVGLIGGAVIFLVGGIAPTILYFGALSNDERPTIASAMGIVVGFTSSAVLAYWAARFNESKTKFSRRDSYLTAVLALTTGAGISLALWWVAGGAMS